MKISFITKFIIWAFVMASMVCGQTWKSGETTFTLSRDGTLRVSGKGPMRDLGSPWESDVKSSITTVVIEEGVTHIGEGVFSSLRRLKSVTIPGSVTSIGKRAFGECYDLKSVTIPNSVTSIGESAFYECYSLKSVIIPGSVTSFGKDAFGYCRDLKSVTISDGVKFIGNRAFYNCIGLTSVTIPGSVTSIGKDAFIYCLSLTSVTIPGSVKSIGNWAFGACTSLTSINVNKDNPFYSSVGGVLFNKAQDTLIRYPDAKQGRVYAIPNSVTTIEGGAFNRSVIPFYQRDTLGGYTGLTSVTIPGSVTSIGHNAFAECTGLTSVTISSGVIAIGYSAFFGCSGLKSITIPNSVTSIGEDAFLGCNLASVTSLNPIPPAILGDFTFGKTVYTNDGAYRMLPTTATLYVPVSGLYAYKKAPVWKNFKNIQVHRN